MLLRNLSTTVATQVIGLLFGIITSVLINRSLLPEGKGLFATYLVSLELVVTLSNLGINKGVMYHIAQAKGDERSQMIGTAMSTALLNVILVAVGIVVMFRVTGDGSIQALPATALPLAVITGMLTVLSSYFEQILRAQEYIWLCNIGTMVRRISYLGFLLVGAATIGLTIELVMVIYLLAVMTLMLYFLRQLFVTGLSFNRQWSIMRKFIRYGLHYQLYSFSTVLHQRLDVVIMGLMLSATQIGYYSSAVGLAQLLWTLPTALNFVVVPFVANQNGESDRSGLVTATVTRVTLVLLSIVGLILGLFAPLIIVTLYGEAFLPMVLPFRIIIPGIIAYSIFHVSASYLIGKQHLLVLTCISMFTLTINIVLNLLLIPAFGAEGAAATSSITYTLSAVFVVAVTSKYSNVDFCSFFIVSTVEVRTILDSGRRVLTNIKVGRLDLN